MMTPKDVAVIVRLGALGWGSKRIAQELKISRNTVRRHLKLGTYVPYQKPERDKALDAHQDWLRQRFLQHRGNADVVRQELEKEHGLVVSLRTVQRAVEPFRQELRAEALATVRFETPPGQQLQVDFGTAKVLIAGEEQRVELCVLTLGYSRRCFVKAFACQRLEQWLEGLEEGFHHFGGVPEELLVDNATPLVKRHDVMSGEVEFTHGFREFCRHWGVRARACAPYRARTKGKDERTVGYVKNNAIAGRTFASWSQFEAHLAQWTREIADERIHGTTEERPLERFERDERQHLRPIAGRPRYMARRELTRKVQSDATVEVDTNHYSVPWRHIRRAVNVVVTADAVTISLDGAVLAHHPRASGRKVRVIDNRHLDGIVRNRKDLVARLAGEGAGQGDVGDTPAPEHEGYSLLRPLQEYDACIGGAL